MATGHEYKGVSYFFDVKFHPTTGRQHCVTLDGERMTDWFETQEEAVAMFKEMVDD